MNQIIPLVATPSQTLSVTLSSQPIRLNVYQKAFGLYVDIYVNDVLIVGGVIGLNLVKMVRAVYLGFIGDLFFYDTQGTSDPDYTQLGDRFVLIYTDA